MKINLRMDTLERIFGSGGELSVQQMTCRAVAIFIISIALIRISGRRSFGIGTSFDNITTILLGSVLARTITGSSPFFPTLAAATAIVVLHRLTGIVVIKNRTAAKVVEGSRIYLYEHGHFNEGQMTRALVSHEDVLRSVRQARCSEDLSNIECIYMERSGEISILLKDPSK